MLTVGDVMCRKPFVLPESARLCDTARLLLRSGCSDLMVENATGEWVGVVSEGDVLRALLPRTRISGDAPWWIRATCSSAGHAPSPKTRWRAS